MAHQNSEGLRKIMMIGHACRPNLYYIGLHLPFFHSGYAFALHACLSCDLCCIYKSSATIEVCSEVEKEDFVSFVCNNIRHI